MTDTERKKDMNKQKRGVCLLLAAVILSLSLLSCRGSTRVYSEVNLDLFDTVTEFIAHTSDDDRFRTVSHSLFGLLEGYHRYFDIYNTYDGIVNLATVNRSAGSDSRSFTVSAEIYELILFGKEAHELTEGRINIAMGSVLSIWRECRADSSPALPTEEALNAAAKHTDIDSLVLSNEGGKLTLTVTDPLLTIDVGAIAKGFVAKKAVELLSSLKLENEGFLLNLGGMVCPVGAKPSGDAWTVGIEHPDTKPHDGYLRQASFSSGSLVTSSDHLRAFTVDGVSYGHIIDPRTLFPPRFFASVSVYCHDPALGDLLSTALFCMTEDEGRTLIKALDGVAVMWVYPDMSVSATENFESILIP